MTRYARCFFAEDTIVTVRRRQGGVKIAPPVHIPRIDRSLDESDIGPVTPVIWMWKEPRHAGVMLQVCASAK